MVNCQSRLSSACLRSEGVFGDSAKESRVCLCWRLKLPVKAIVIMTGEGVFGDSTNESSVYVLC